MVTGNGWQQVKKGNGYFWNSTAGLLYAGEAVILSIAVTRTSGLADAGILSMAFAIGHQNRDCCSDGGGQFCVFILLYAG